LTGKRKEKTRASDSLQSQNKRGAKSTYPEDVHLQAVPQKKKKRGTLGRTQGEKIPVCRVARQLREKKRAAEGRGQGWDLAAMSERKSGEK